MGSSELGIPPESWMASWFMKITGMHIRDVPEEHLEHAVRMFRVATLSASAELVYGAERARESFGDA